MKKHSAFPKIGQFRDVIRAVRLRSTYVGKDENGDPIYDNTQPVPTITFKGTVKLHGTNSGFAENGEDGYWVQSRENIITPENDNYGFARFVEDNIESFKELVEHVRYVNTKVNPNDTVIVFGEWVGKGIQKNVSISQLEKTFFIFDVKIVPEDGTEPYHIPSDYLRDEENRIYNIEDFLSYKIDIDFKYPELSQNKLGEITLEVEKLCPVGKAFDIEGIGEGVVWIANVNGHDYRFKVKGEKHSVSKNKTLAPVDVEKITNIKEFVDYAVTQNRFDQGMGIVFPSGVSDIKKMGDVIRWVVNDVTTEEIETLAQNGLEPKDVNKYISTKVRTMFLEQYNKI